MITGLVKRAYFSFTICKYTLLYSIILVPINFIASINLRVVLDTSSISLPFLAFTFVIGFLAYCTIKSCISLNHVLEAEKQLDGEQHSKSMYRTLLDKRSQQPRFWLAARILAIIYAVISGVCIAALGYVLFTTLLSLNSLWIAQFLILIPIVFAGPAYLFGEFFVLQLRKQV